MTRIYSFKKTESSLRHYLLFHYRFCQEIYLMGRLAVKFFGPDKISVFFGHPFGITAQINE